MQFGSNFYIFCQFFPLISWAEENRDNLNEIRSSLEFKLHRLRFIDLLKQGPSHQSQALQYSRNFEAFADRHTRGIFKCSWISLWKECKISECKISDSYYLAKSNKCKTKKYKFLLMLRTFLLLCKHLCTKKFDYARSPSLNCFFLF